MGQQLQIVARNNLWWFTQRIHKQQISLLTQPHQLALGKPWRQRPVPLVKQLRLRIRLTVICTCKVTTTRWRDQMVRFTVIWQRRLPQIACMTTRLTQAQLMQAHKTSRCLTRPTPNGHHWPWRMIHQSTPALWLAHCPVRLLRTSRLMGQMQR